MPKKLFKIDLALYLHKTVLVKGICVGMGPLHKYWPDGGMDSVELS
jgi:hypothetical protein